MASSERLTFEARVGEDAVGLLPRRINEDELADLVSGD